MFARAVVVRLAARVRVRVVFVSIRLVFVPIRRGRLVLFVCGEVPQGGRIWGGLLVREADDSLGTMTSWAPYTRIAGARAEDDADARTAANSNTQHVRSSPPALALSPTLLAARLPISSSHPASTPPSFSPSYRYP